MTNWHKYCLLICTLACLGWMACTQERAQCYTPKIAVLNIECMHLPTDTATAFVDTALPQTLLAAYSGTGTQFFIYRTQNANFTISLSSVADSCKWGITTDTVNNNFDTLTFYYKRRLQFLSNACGYADFYDLDSVRTTSYGSNPAHIIDSVHITNYSVTNNVNTKHLQVYIHPGF